MWFEPSKGLSHPPAHTFMVACMDIYISALPISRQVIHLQDCVNLKSQPVCREKTFCDMTDLAKTRALVYLNPLSWNMSKEPHVWGQTAHFVDERAEQVDQRSQPK